MTPEEIYCGQIDEITETLRQQLRFLDMARSSIRSGGDLEIIADAINNIADTLEILTDDIYDLAEDVYPGGDDDDEYESDPEADDIPLGPSIYRGENDE